MGLEDKFWLDLRKHASDHRIYTSKQQQAARAHMMENAAQEMHLRDACTHDDLRACVAVKQDCLACSKCTVCIDTVCHGLRGHGCQADIDLSAACMEKKFVTAYPAFSYIHWECGPARGCCCTPHLGAT